MFSQRNLETLKSFNFIDAALYPREAADLDQFIRNYVPVLPSIEEVHSYEPYIVALGKTMLAFGKDINIDASDCIYDPSHFHIYPEHAAPAIREDFYLPKHTSFTTLKPYNHAIIFEQHSRVETLKVLTRSVIEMAAYTSLSSDISEPPYLTWDMHRSGYIDFDRGGFNSLHIGVIELITTYLQHQYWQTQPELSDIVNNNFQESVTFVPPSFLIDQAIRHSPDPLQLSRELMENMFTGKNSALEIVSFSFGPSVRRVLEQMESEPEAVLILAERLGYGTDSFFKLLD